MPYRAIMTAHLPTPTRDLCGMGTMTCHRPAVMQRPYDGLSHLPECAKQDGVVQIVSVQVVQVNHIRVHVCDLRHEFPCGTA